MSKLIELKNKENNSPIEECIIWAIKTDETKEKAAADLVALREAGEKMAEQLREMRDYTGGTFTPEDAAALEAWEAANK